MPFIICVGNVIIGKGFPVTGYIESLGKGIQGSIIVIRQQKKEIG